MRGVKPLEYLMESRGVLSGKKNHFNFLGCFSEKLLRRIKLISLYFLGLSLLRICSQFCFSVSLPRYLTDNSSCTLI